jgi:hypothetical protein
MSESENNNQPQPDQDRIAGRYLLTEHIGQGRLGDIFNAVDEDRQSVGAEQHFALQIVSPVISRNNSLFNKLRIGYQSLRVAGHPNIVNYRSFDRDGSKAYLVMERLEGASLSVLLDNAEALPLDEVRPVLRGVGDALKFLHAEGVVHGNLTASNVFITDTLDTQLLDVVPLSATSGVFRGATTDSSIGGTTIADDVFALACLAYQMLAGRHPFGDSNPARADLAAREPDRIPGLDDNPWNALRRALMLEGQEPGYAPGDFLRDFGVRGNEHLQPVVMNPAAAEVAPAPAPVAAAPQNITAEPATVEVTEPGLPDRWPQLDAEAPGASYWRTAMLSVVLAGLGTWYFLGQPDERIADLIAYLDSSTNSAVTAQAIVAAAQPEVRQPEIEQLEMLQPLSEDEVVAVEPGATAGLATAGQEPAAEPIVEPAVVPGMVEEELIGPPSEPFSEPETVVTDLVEPAAEPIDEATVEPVAEEPIADEPKIGFTESVAVVSEQSAMAQVRLWREPEFQLPLVWWTSDNTARADMDYVIVPERAVDLAYDGTLSIPLVNDNLPEQRESFYVDVGVRKPQGQIERLASIRVDIVDDDLR